MKNSKTFLVLTVALFLVFAVSACTAAPEMLKGFAVGDKVRVTFDENENVSKIEKREETPETDEKEDKENSKDNYDIVTKK